MSDPLEMMEAALGVQHQAFVKASDIAKTWAEKYRVLSERCQQAEKERDEVREAFGFVYCAFCGERLPTDAPDLQGCSTGHIQTCPKHPMRMVERECANLEARLQDSQQLVDALRDELDELAHVAEERFPELLALSDWTERTEGKCWRKAR